VQSELMVGRGAEMKGKYRRVVALGLFLLALNAVVLAQDFTSKVRVNIPFSFYAGDKMLPAGDYILALDRETSNVAIRGENQNAAAFLFGSPNDGVSKGLTVLTFHSNANGEYVLEKLQAPDFGLSFARHKGGAKGATTAVKNDAAHDTQVLVARLSK
jgi:hypothetical protein